jgi:3-hydroxymyristoyl/3-hydroxydecanoyl-(acyl carrier protein) dehydratase
MTSERFRAFSFVDRITRSAGGRIEGHYTVPAKSSCFPAALMAEAVGQLAAWSAMSELGFAWRPVAGLAAETRFHRIVEPGQTLTLEADLERCDREAVAYDGRALIDGECALELAGCVGPMLPMEEFDAPEAVHADFQTLFSIGAAPDRFAGVPAPQFESVERDSGRRVRARLLVPGRSDVAYFADHFPRRAVFPGTLLLDAMAELAAQAACEAVPEHRGKVLQPARVSNIKIRSFTEPGTALELEIELLSIEAERARFKLLARNDGKTVATGRIEIEPQAEATP